MPHACFYGKIEKIMKRMEKNEIGTVILQVWHDEFWEND